MNDKVSGSEKTFLDRQRARLLQLRVEVLRAIKAEEIEETGIREESLGAAQESEDDAQRLALLELDGTLVRRNIERLPMIERALEKIKEGTYGFSDASGKPIPLERLEVMPEAISTADEDVQRGAVR
jgi:DnaK suppressor protein